MRTENRVRLSRFVLVAALAVTVSCTEVDELLDEMSDSATDTGEGELGPDGSKDGDTDQPTNDDERDNDVEQDPDTSNPDGSSSDQDPQVDDPDEEPPAEEPEPGDGDEPDGSASCGDGECQPEETCSSCESDCGSCLPDPETGTVWYVSTDGNDGTGDGSQNKPWKTLAHATSRVKTADDVIHLTKGRFVETAASKLAPGVHIQGSGATGAARTVLQGAFDGGIIQLAQCAGNRISHLLIDGSDRKADTGISIENGQGLEVHHANFVNIERYAILFPGGKHGSHRIHHCSFENSSFGNNAGTKGDITVDGRLTGDFEGLTIHDCQFTADLKPDPQNNGAGTGCGIALKSLSSGNHLFKNFKVYNNTFKPSVYMKWKFAMELFWVNFADAEIRDCKFISAELSLGNPQGIDTVNKTIRVHHNEWDLREPAGPTGLWMPVEIKQPKLEFDHNYIHGYCAALFGDSGQNPGTPDLNQHYHHNVIDVEGAQMAFAMDAPTLNWKIDNNTFIFRRGGGAFLRAGRSQSDRKVENFNMRNNIIVTHGTPWNLVVRRNGFTTPGLVAQNNILININASEPGASNSIDQDPDLLSSGAKPFPFYSIDQSSPAYDRGVDVGFEYRGAAPDIGAFEVGLSKSGN